MFCVSGSVLPVFSSRSFTVSGLTSRKNIECFTNLRVILVQGPC